MQIKFLPKYNKDIEKFLILRRENNFKNNNMIKMKNNKKVKFLKLQLSAALVLLAMVIASGVFIFTPISWQQVAQALTGNYSKNTGDQLNNSDWNNLLVDFLSKDGGSQVDRGDGTMIDNSMHGDLDMGSHRITNLADPTNDADAATKGYVDTSITGAGGGAIFVNWGREDCPVGTTKIYGGWAFSSYWNKEGGATNVMCLQNDFADIGDPSTNYASEIVPLKLASSPYIPSSLSASERRKVKCAVCYNPGSTCYIAWGTDNCASSFSSTSGYTGWAMGGFTLEGRLMETDMYCVNSNFDNTSPSDLSFDNASVWYGGKIESLQGLPPNNYSEGTFIRCAVCCN